MADEPREPASSARFPTTQWSRVVAAADSNPSEARRALADLCENYWYPIYILIRRQAGNADEARDLTQDYFARLLEKEILAAVDRREGRFRTFLRVDCGFFLADERDRDHAQKRGGGLKPISIDLRDAEGRYLAEPIDTSTAERLFDRAWATTLLDRAVDQVESEHRESGREDMFNELHHVLIGDHRALPYAEIAARLGKTEAAVQSAVSRLRRRFREVVRERIAATLDNPDAADIEDELRALFAALSR